MKINIYEGNSIDVDCYVTSSTGVAIDVSSYTATLTIKKNKNDVAALLTSTGIIVTSTITFNIDAATNTLAKGSYYYEVTIELSPDKYTVAQDRLIVYESIVYIS
jgi:rRNA processing protein Krr1/Pno1